MVKSMFDPQIRNWILTLDSTRGVHFIRALLLAEATRLGLDLGVVRMTGVIQASDEGIDGRTDFPAEAITVFPKGPWSWQIKVYGKGRRPSASEEVSKPGVQKDIRAGRGYVMVWLSQDPADPDKQKRDLTDEVHKSAPQAPVELLTVAEIERLAAIHPAVVQVHGGPSSAWAHYCSVVCRLRS